MDRLRLRRSHQHVAARCRGRGAGAGRRGVPGGALGRLLDKPGGVRRGRDRRGRVLGRPVRPARPARAGRAPTGRADGGRPRGVDARRPGHRRPAGGTGRTGRTAGPVVQRAERHGPADRGAALVGGLPAPAVQRRSGPDQARSADLRPAVRAARRAAGRPPVRRRPAGEPGRGQGSGDRVRAVHRRPRPACRTRTDARRRVLR